jgi:ADP-ribosylglycohydrolase
MYGPNTSIGRINNWYYDASTKEFVANEEGGIYWPACGGDDTQADALVHMIPVVALLAGDTAAMLSTLEPIIRVTQNTDEAVAFGFAGARIFEKVLIYNMTGLEAVNETITDMLDPNRASPQTQDAALADGLALMLTLLNETNFQVVQQVGQSCDYPHNLWTGAHLISQLGASQADFINATRQTIMAGGDSGSRNFFVGAIQAARLGNVSLLPSAWTAQVEEYSYVAPRAQSLVAARSQALAAARNARRVQ